MKKLFILFLVAVTGLFGCSTPEVTEIQNGIQFKTDSCIVQVQKCPLNGTLEKKSLMVVIDSLEPVSFRTIKRSKFVTIESTELSVKIDAKTGAITYKNDGKEIVSEKGFSDFTPYINEKNGENSFSVGQTFTLADGEAIYGLGQNQSGILNYRGHSEKLVQTNTDAVIPFIWSTAGFGILWDNYSKTTFTT